MNAFGMARWGGWVVALLVFLTACSPSGPRPILYGEETCNYCRMTITDPRFGAEVRTEKGRVEVFDSIECAAGFVQSVAAGDVTAVWVSDYAEPGTFVPVEQATFWRTTGTSTPMGSGLVASASRQPPAGVTVSSTALEWGDVLTLVQQEGLRGAASGSESGADSGADTSAAATGDTHVPHRN